MLCSEMRGTWLESHFRRQIRMFWFGLLWISLCVILIIVTFGIGPLVTWLPMIALGALVPVPDHARLGRPHRWSAHVCVNCLPVIKRMQRHSAPLSPRTEVLDGRWKFSKAQPVNRAGARDRGEESRSTCDHDSRSRPSLWFAAYRILPLQPLEPGKVVVA